MFHNQRLIWGTTELSQELNDFRAGSATFAYTTGTYVYIGQERPFNNLYVDVGAGNASASEIDVKIWYANAWQSAVDIADGTASGGVSMLRSGRISWNTSWDKNWDLQDRVSRIPGLEDFEIYDLYWIRLNWDAAFSAGTILKYVGQKFCSETDLVGHYPDLRNASMKLSFGGGPSSGKTTWDDEIFAATDQVIQDLKSRQLIEVGSQILDWTIFMEPCIHKTAELIYRGCGPQFRQNVADVAVAYAKSMNKDKFRIDKDKDGKLSDREKSESVTYMTR